MFEIFMTYIRVLLENVCGVCSHVHIHVHIHSYTHIQSYTQMYVACVRCMDDVFFLEMHMTYVHILLETVCSVC